MDKESGTLYGNCVAIDAQSTGHYKWRQEDIHCSFSTNLVGHSEEDEATSKAIEIHRAEKINGGLRCTHHIQCNIPVVDILFVRGIRSILKRAFNNIWVISYCTNLLGVTRLPNCGILSEEAFVFLRGDHQRKS